MKLSKRRKLNQHVRLYPNHEPHPQHQTERPLTKDAAYEALADGLVSVMRDTFGKIPLSGLSNAPTEIVGHIDILEAPRR